MAIVAVVFKQSYWSDTSQIILQAQFVFCFFNLLSRSALTVLHTIIGIDGGNRTRFLLITVFLSPLQYTVYHLIRPGFVHFKFDSFYMVCKHFVF